METKRRSTDAYTSGSTYNSITTQNFNKKNKVEEQRTISHDTAFPAIRHALRQPYIRGTGAEWVFTHRDYGATFVTEKTSVQSSFDGSFGVLAAKGGNLPYYQAHSDGPLFLGWHSLMSLSTDAELGNYQQSLWTMGARAIKIVRPAKPALDIPVLLGELRKDGLPTIIGSLAGRSKTVRDVFRQGGKEYLNVQFGWAPLIRDLVTLVELVPDARRRILQYERDIERLIRRRYYFPEEVSVTSGLSFSGTSSSYMLEASTPFGTIPQDHFSFSRGGSFLPEQVTKTTQKTWFSGGFRFYHRSVPKALEELSLIEEKANILLGTRLDPEILWNLAPWTWLSDWFVNFGDVVSNVSALIADDLVMQYGYLMRTTETEVQVSWPNGLWYRKPSGPLSSGWRRWTGQVETMSNRNLPALGGYTQTMRRVLKQRVRASPFGFGLNPSDFSADQLAILAALGLSRT
jgi:hypothetical protein